MRSLSAWIALFRASAHIHTHKYLHTSWFFLISCPPVRHFLPKRIKATHGEILARVPCARAPARHAEGGRSVLRKQRNVYTWRRSDKSCWVFCNNYSILRRLLGHTNTRLIPVIRCPSKQKWQLLQASFFWCLFNLLWRIGFVVQPSYCSDIWWCSFTIRFETGKK